MTLLAPLWLAAAGVAAAGVVLIHFFARRRPRPMPLPTARFVPDVAARAPALASTPSDLLLLVLRVLAVAALGLALARPSREPSRRDVVRIAIVDGDSAGLDSARALGVDTTIDGRDGQDGQDGQKLSALLVRAIRASAIYRDRADSLELIIVSAFVEESFDAATDSIRRLWPGRARLIHLAAPAQPPWPRIVLAGDLDDPLRATVALLGAGPGPEIRIERGPPSAGRLVIAQGGPLVVWPRDPAAAWPTRSADTIGAVSAGGAVVVAPFVRGALIQTDSASRAIAFWADGKPAAVEQTVGPGCLRLVGIPVPEVGDLVLRRSMRDLVVALTSPCGGRRRLAPAPESQLASLRGDGPLMPAAAAPSMPRRASLASAWLFALAAALLLGEMIVRPRARAS